MTRTILGAVLAAIAASALMTGCTTTGSNTGTVRGGAGSGWENFRAEVAALSKNA